MRKKVFWVLFFLFISIPASAQQPAQPTTPPPTREELNEFIKKVIEMKKNIKAGMDEIRTGMETLKTESSDEIAKIQKELVEMKAEAKKAATQKLTPAPILADSKAIKELTNKIEELKKEVTEAKKSAQKPNSPAPTPADVKALKDLERRIVHAQRGVNKLERAIATQPRLDRGGINRGIAELALDKATKALSKANNAIHKAENAYNRADMAFSRATQAQEIAFQNTTALKTLAENTARALEKQADKRAVKSPLYWRDDQNLKSLAAMIRRTAQ